MQNMFSYVLELLLFVNNFISRIDMIGNSMQEQTPKQNGLSMPLLK